MGPSFCGSYGFLEGSWASRNWNPPSPTVAAIERPGSAKFPKPNHNPFFSCPSWVPNGFCTSPSYACEQKRQYCAKSCNLCAGCGVTTTTAPSTCVDSNAKYVDFLKTKENNLKFFSCPGWVSNGFCASTFYTCATKKSNCAKSCNLCTTNCGAATTTAPCVDSNAK